MTPSKLDLAIVGAGPVGLGLALHAARTLPRGQVTVYDARALAHDVSGDARTLALALGSVQWLERLEAWDGSGAQPIVEVHVSQQPPSGFGPWREPVLRIRAADEGVAMLGAVLPYGRLVSTLQREWLARCAREPERLVTCFGHAVKALQRQPGGVVLETDGTSRRHALAVVAEGGVFSEQARKAIAHDYGQVAWVGQVEIDGARPGVAYERFTRNGPAALLPLPSPVGGVARAALVWCMPSDDDAVASLDDRQRLAVLASIFPREVGSLVSITPLKRFPLGLNAERTLVDGRVVRIGNAAQTLHPVAGQGLNLGLRDAFELVAALSRHGIDDALRRVEWRRAADRWSMIAATDFLARSFTWRLPGLGAARGAAIAALGGFAPARSLLARQMMFGSR